MLLNVVYLDLCKFVTQVIEKEKKEVKVEPKEQKTVQASKRQSVRDLANKIKDQVHDGPVPPRKKGKHNEHSVVFIHLTCMRYVPKSHAGSNGNFGPIYASSEGSGECLFAQACLSFCHSTKILVKALASLHQQPQQVYATTQNALNL